MPKRYFFICVLCLVPASPSRAAGLSIWKYANVVHPGALGHFSANLQMLRQHDVDPRYLHRAATMMIGSLVFTPLRSLERVIYDRAIAKQKLPRGVFITGHWRSGTTLFANWMAQDEQFTHLTRLQMTTPESAILLRRLLKPLLAKIFPSSRPMDGVVTRWDDLAEADRVLLKTSGLSFDAHMWFPRDTRQLFATYGLLDDISDEKRQRLCDAYHRLFKEAMFSRPGEMLLSKNPIDTARLPLLFELFPEARIINVHRKPYDVFRSTLAMHEKLLPARQLQAIDRDQLIDDILFVYEQLIGQWITDSQRYAETQKIAEVAYEDLVAEPLDVLAGVYDAVDLGPPPEETFRAYQDSIAGYTTNTYPPLSPELVQRINQQWGFAFKHWGYDMDPGPEGASESGDGTN